MLIKRVPVWPLFYCYPSHWPFTATRTFQFDSTDYPARCIEQLANFFFRKSTISRISQLTAYDVHVGVVGFDERSLSWSARMLGM